MFYLHSDSDIHRPKGANLFFYVDHKIPAFDWEGHVEWNTNLQSARSKTYFKIT